MDLDLRPVEMGKRLRKERKRIGLTQAQLATIAEVSRPTQYLYEKGERHPSLAYLYKIRDAGIDEVYVFSGIESEPGTPKVTVDRAVFSHMLKALDVQAEMLTQLQQTTETLRTALEVVGNESKDG